MFSDPQLLPADRVYIEFTRPAAVAGMTLPHGSYLFAISPSVGGQALIDIYTGDASRLLLTCLAIERQQPARDAVSTSMYPRTAPEALRAWFHPGNRFGYELVYPASEAWRIFESSGISVPFTASRKLDRNLLGAFVVRSVGTPPANATAVGTSGIAEAETELKPADHLVAARIIIADRLKSGTPAEAGRMQVFDGQLTELLKLHRGGKNLEPRLSGLMSLLDNAVQNPATSDRQALLALERIQAHLRAYGRR